MKYILRLFLAGVLALATTADAWAASGATTVSALDAGSTSRAFNVFSSTGAVTGNLSWMNNICDITTLTVCAGVDAGHSLQVAGEGTAGSAAGGVVTVQGVASMTPILATVTGTGTFVTQSVVTQGTASNLNAAVVGTGTAGSAAGGVLTVQGVASMTPVQVSQATASSLNATVVGAGSAGTANAGVVTVQGIASMTPILATATVNTWATGTLGAMANYGTSPGAVLVPGVNAFVTNANTNGAASSANSAPVVLPILSHASVTSLGTSLVVKNAAGDLNGFNCTAITGGAAGYCVAYNATSAPGTGALTGALVLDSCYFDTTARGCSLAHVNGSVAYSVGIVILVTSAVTPFTYTTGTDTAYVSADYQ